MEDIAEDFLTNGTNYSLSELSCGGVAPQVSGSDLSAQIGKSVEIKFAGMSSKTYISSKLGNQLDFNLVECYHRHISSKLGNQMNSKLMECYQRHISSKLGYQLNSNLLECYQRHISSKLGDQLNSNIIVDTSHLSRLQNPFNSCFQSTTICLKTNMLKKLINDRYIY